MRTTRILLAALLMSLLGGALQMSRAGAAETAPPPSPEITAAMQPYLNSYKLAGYVGIVADKTGRIHYRNVQGFAEAFGTDLSVHPQTGLVAVFMVQCPGPDQWEARDMFLKTATRIFPNKSR